MQKFKCAGKVSFLLPTLSSWQVTQVFDFFMRTKTGRKKSSIQKMLDSFRIGIYCMRSLKKRVLSTQWQMAFKKFLCVKVYKASFSADQLICLLIEWMDLRASTCFIFFAFLILWPCVTFLYSNQIFPVIVLRSVNEAIFFYLWRQGGGE